MGQSHAFISYVRENKDIVDRLAGDLRTYGVKVWLDRDDIAPGQYWKDAIRDAIQNGAYFIACFSKELNERQETYMHGELRLAIDRLRNIPRSRVWFIPVLLNDTYITSHAISDNETLSAINTVTLFQNWKDGVRQILRAMKLEDPDYRRTMHLIELLRFHPSERAHAAKQLGDLCGVRVPVEAVPALSETLRDKEQDVRRYAAEALGKIGPAAAEAVPALSEALRDERGNVRWHAAEALGKIGLAAAEAVPALSEALRDKRGDVREHTTEALGKIGPAAVPALIEALRDRDKGVRWHAAEALGKIGPAAAEAVPALSEALRDKEQDVRRCAAEALGKIGQPPKPYPR